MSEAQIIYTPNGPQTVLNAGSFRVIRLMWGELVGSRELTLRLFARDFKGKYRQSMLGVAWAVLLPAVTIGVFIGMRSSGLLNIGDVGVPYPLHALIGLAVWNLFSSGLTSSASALTSAGGMISKINFPKVSLIIAATGQAVVELCIRMLLIATLFLYYQVAPHPTGLLIGVVCMLPLYLMMAGIGFIVSLIAGVLRDVADLLNVALLGLMLMTPILYPIAADSFLGRANFWNPLNYLVNVPRDFILQGHTLYMAEYGVSVIVSFLVAYLGARLFYLAQTRIAERI